MEKIAEGRTLWLLAGQALLRRGGAAAVKLHALAAETGLTTGSFYHHFSGMPEYLDQLAGFYGTEQAAAVLESVNDADPRARLRKLAGVARREEMGALDAAMRDWSGSNALAAQSVRRADRLLLRFVEAAFTELGYRGHEAQMRAHLLYAAGVARVTPPWKQPNRSVEAVLDVLAPRHR